MGFIVFVSLAKKDTRVETTLQLIMWNFVRSSKIYYFELVKWILIPSTKFFWEKTITICNCIPIVLNKLHKTLVANVNEVNSQQMFHRLYTIICYINYHENRQPT